MSDKGLQRTRRVGEPRLGRQREIPGDVQALGRGPGRLLGRDGQAHRLDQALHQGQEHLLRARQRLDQMVRGRHAQRLAPTASTATCKTRGDQVAIIWEGDDPTHDEKITYRQLHERVCKFANVLKANGVKKGDRVTIYLPMIPEAAYAMLACARIGAVHSVVFGGFSPDSLAGRIDRLPTPSSSSPPTKACAAAGRCRSRRTPTRRCKKCKGGEKVLVVRRTGSPIAMDAGPRHLAARGAGEGRRRLPAGGDERRGPAVHPLHLRLDRQAQGRAAHHRRLSRLRRR